MAVANARSVKIWVIACSLYSCHSENSTIKKNETAYQPTISVVKTRAGTTLGVRLMISSSMASRKVMMTTRALTSHASHARSLNLVSAIFFALPPLLSGQLGDHREHREVERNHDSANHKAEKANQHWLHQRQQVLGGGIHFIFVEVGDFLQHRVHGAGGFAHADHLRDHVGKHAALAQRIDNRAAFFHGLPDFHQGLFQHGVSRSARG